MNGNGGQQGHRIYPVVLIVVKVHVIISILSLKKLAVYALCFSAMMHVLKNIKFKYRNGEVDE